MRSRRHFSASGAAIARRRSALPAFRSTSAPPTAAAPASGRRAIRHASRMLVDGAHPLHWVDPAKLPVADIGDFALALGDLVGSLKLIEDAAAGHRAPDRARRRSHRHATAVARAEKTARPARAHSLRCARRYLARQFRPGLRPRLGVLPRHRGRPGRSAPDDPDRHPLAGAAGGSRLDRGAWRGDAAGAKRP